MLHTHLLYSHSCKHTQARTHTHTCVPPAAVQALAISPGPSSRPLNSIRCTRKGLAVRERWAASTKPRHTAGPSLVYQTSEWWRTRHTVAKKRGNGAQRAPAPGSLPTGSTHARARAHTHTHTHQRTHAHTHTHNRDSAAEGKKLPQRCLIRRWRHVEHLRSAGTERCAAVQACMSVAAKGSAR